MPDETKRVFCKGCRWYVREYSPSNPDVLIAEKCVPVPHYNPITGDIYTGEAYRWCEQVNVNYDCSNYEAKEVGDE